MPEDIHGNYPETQEPPGFVPHRSSFLYNCTSAAVASPLATIVYYPARDFAKLYGQIDCSPLHFILSRYKGMVTAPEIPFLVSLPYTATLLSYQLVERLTWSSVLPVFGCGIAGAVTKEAVRKYSVNIGARKNFHGDYLHKGPLQCIANVTKERGPAYWIQGFGALSVVNSLWFGAGLRSVKWQLPKKQRSFSEDTFIVARTMTFWGFFTAPLRNGTYQVVRNLGVDGSRRIVFGSEFWKREVHHIGDSLRAMHRIGMGQGLGGMFRGSFMLVFKTNIPFGLFFATYRAFGGTF